MAMNQAFDAYRRTEKQAAIHPVKLIHMMFERVLTHLDYAEEAIREKNPKKRGENMGKAIALITELNASIKQEDESEAARFLRGLYTSMLVELPRVAVSNDITILRQAGRYIRELKKIWEETAMQEEGVLDAPKGPVCEVECKMEPQAEAGKIVGAGLSVSI